jgi:hypothetical protein
MLWCESLLHNYTHDYSRKMSPSQTFSISQPTTNLIELVLLNKPTIVATFNMLTAISL